MNKIKLTKRTVEAVKPNDARICLHDTEIKGFQCRISPAGVRTYYLYYRTENGRERRPKIGEHGTITSEEARTIAKRWMAEVASGQDPSLERQIKRKGETVRDFAGRYLDQYAKVKKKASSAETDALNINVHIIPNLGNLKVTDVSRRDIVRLHQSMSNTPYAANRVLALLSKMFNLAEQWDERPQASNPCMHIDKYKEHKRERYLTMNELAKLSGVLKEVELENVELASVVPAIRLLLFTGCRRNEILTLRWEFVDYQEGYLNLPDSKTGKKTINLTAPVREILTSITKLPNNPYVITGAKTGAHLVNLRKPWTRIRERVTLAIWKEQKDVLKVIEALMGQNGSVPSLKNVQEACLQENITLEGGLLDVRLHDFRHTYASAGVGGGQSLPIVGKLLGHTQPQTTARYAHLADDPVRRAADTIAADLEAAMEGQKLSNIVKIQGGKNE